MIAGTTIATAGVIFGVAGAAAKAHRQKPVTGVEELIGSRAEVVDWKGSAGHVRVHGEIWSARAEGTFHKHASVRVVALEGLTLLVEPV